MRRRKVRKNVPTQYKYQHVIKIHYQYNNSDIWILRCDLVWSNTNYKIWSCGYSWSVLSFCFSRKNHMGQGDLLGPRQNCRQTWHNLEYNLVFLYNCAYIWPYWTLEKFFIQKTSFFSPQQMSRRAEESSHYWGDIESLLTYFMY